MISGVNQNWSQKSCKCLVGKSLIRELAAQTTWMLLILYVKWLNRLFVIYLLGIQTIDQFSKI